MTANWRSLLFVPANAPPGFLARAHERGADGLIIDLEDGVASSAKANARAGLGELLKGLTGKGADLLVRINASWAEAVLDLRAAVNPSLAAIVVPKVEETSRLEVISEMMAEFENEQELPTGAIGLVALIETPRGLSRAAQLAAVPRVVALALGPEDMCLVLGVNPTPDVLDLPCRQLALAAATRELQCLAMPISLAAISDSQGFASAADRAFEVGCTGALCVHPSQVKIANERFAPDAQARIAAERTLSAWRVAQAEGKSVVEFEGIMIDAPVAERARRLLQRRHNC
jgi:citrate lyase subunit beta/citryl-CoA lyase